jgi:hypothetical protein
MEQYVLPARRGIEVWCENHPSLLAVFDRFNQQAIRWGIFSGTAVELLVGARTGEDVDLLLHNEDFDRVPPLLPNPVVERNKLVEIACDDQQWLRYRADEITAEVDGRQLQIMRSAGGVYCGTHRYEMSLTDLAAENRLSVEVNGVVVYFAHPFETMAIKAAMQRGSLCQKQDLPDVQALAARGSMPSEYVHLRAAEMGLDERVQTFLGRAGLQLAS